ncbi:MAG: response regulator, partial [Cytophagales bacterium]|nr:response regulator [Cytophagales bacterium]
DSRRNITYWNAASGVYTKVTGSKSKGKSNFIYVCHPSLDKSGNLWFSGGGDDVFRLDAETLSVDRVKVYNREGGPAVGANKKIYADSQGTVWLFRGKNAFYYKQSRGFVQTSLRLTTAGNKDVAISSLTDSGKRIYVASRSSGVLYFDKEHVQGDNTDIMVLKPFPGNTMKLETESEAMGRHIAQVYWDRSEHLWVTVSKGATFIFSEKEDIFSAKLPGLPALRVTSSCAGQGGWLWLTTFENGVFRYNLKTGQAKKYLGGTEMENRFSSVLKDSKGRLWFGSRRGNMYFYDKAEDRLANTAFDTGPEVFTLKDLQEDEYGNLWFLSSGKGLFRLDPDSDQLRFFSSRSCFRKPGWKSGFLLSENGKILVAGGGMDVCAYDGYSVKPLEISQMIGNLPILSVCPNSRGGYWLGGENGLLYRMSNSGELMETIRQTEGRFFVKALAMQEDLLGRLWIASEIGLSVYDPSSQAFHHFGDEHHVIKPSFLGNFFSCLPDGRLFFTSVSGTVFIDPEKFVPFDEENEVVLTDIFVNGRKLKSREVQYGSEGLETLSLEYGVSMLTINFTTSGFGSLQNKRFAYRLSSDENGWSYTNADSSYLNLKDLSEGVHVLEIKSRNSNGSWPQDSKTIRIVVNPPFWLSRYAYGIYFAGLMIGLMLYVMYIKRRAYYKYRLQVLRTRQEEDKRKFEERMALYTNIAHELRTPLTLVQGPIEAAMEGMRNREKREMLQMASEQVSLLVQMVDQLLVVRKIEDGVERLRLDYHNITRFVGHLADMFRLEAEKKDIQWDVSLPDIQHHGWFDEEKLSIVLRNLFSNAIKYTDTSGIVSVELKVDENTNWVELSVKDNGRGIEDQNQKLIFEKYFRAGHVPKISGNGVGLFVVKQLLDLHQAEISLESKLGKGSCFRVRFNVDAAHYHGVASVETAAAERTQLKDIDEYEDGKKKRVRIMVVDDDDSIRSFLVRVLSSAYRVCEASSGEEALESLHRGKLPHLIISDVLMPGMDGITFCKKLKGSPELMDIPILLLSARGSWEDRASGIDQGADDFMQKPFHVKELKAKVASMLRARSKAAGWKISEEDSSLVSAEEKFMKLVLSVIRENIHSRSLGVDWLCEKLKVSRTGLYMRVKKQCGLTPLELVRSERMKRAAQLLRDEPTMGVQEIAEEVGYFDARYFREQFKKIYGSTPSAYRKQASREALEEAAAFAD